MTCLRGPARTNEVASLCPGDRIISTKTSGKSETVKVTNLTLIMSDSNTVPLQTFITAEGGVCREYEASRAGDGVTGIACRFEETWRVETLVTNAQAVQDTGSSLLPASGFDTAALEAVLEDMGALPGLGIDAEQCLIDNAWKPVSCEEKIETWE